jgi:gamma-glutamylcysteine synthetase
MPVHLLVIPLALSPLPTPSPAVGFSPWPCPRSAGELPTLSDWESHLTTVFPEVRLKRFLEMRGADAGPWRIICGLPALWVGLLYDAQAQVCGCG